MEIKLPSGHIVLIDDEDYKIVSNYHWHIKKGYAEAWTNDKRPSSLKSIRMHRLIMPHITGIIDHINHNPLDNRKINLRECNRSTNAMNRGKQANNTSGYKGVSWSVVGGKWQVQICKNKKRIGLGYYGNILDARDAYIEAAKEIHGEFAKY